MMMTAPPPPPHVRPVHCPICQAYLGSIGVDGSYMRFPPCRQCGWQWVGEAVGKRARRELPDGESIEVKAR